MMNVYLSGRERAAPLPIGWSTLPDRIVDVTARALKRDGSHEWLRPLLRPGLSSAPPSHLSEWLRNALLVGSDTFRTAAGEAVNGFHVALNTAWAAGSDAERLMIRLRAQAEFGCLIEGRNRPWVADLLRGGGSDRAVDLLAERDDEPVIAYAVDGGGASYWCMPTAEEGHPIACSILCTGLDVEEEYADLDMRRDEVSPDAMWAAAVAKLRRLNETMLLEIKPEGWADYRFAHTLTAQEFQDMVPPALEPR